MNDTKLISQSAKSAVLEGYDDVAKRWERAQIETSSKYVEFLLKLVKMGKLRMPWSALKTLLETKGGEVKMVLDSDSRTFLRDVTSEFDEPLSVKSLARRGYDADADVISYKGVGLWPRAVLDESDERTDTKAMRRQLNTMLNPEYTRTFARYLDLTFKNRSHEVAFALLSERERKSLMEGSDGAGGNLVPADFIGTMLARVTAKSIVRSLATVIPTVRDALILPAFAPNATSPSIFSSGFVGSWAAETPLWQDNDPGIGSFSAPIKKLRVGVKLSRDLMNDAGGVEWLTTNGADNLAVGEDEKFLNGSGAGLEPLGILNGGITTVDVEGSTANTISNTTGADGSGSKMLTLAGSLPSQYQRDAVLVTASATEASINKLVDGSRRFLYPRRRGPDGRRELLGYPVDDSPHMPLEGTDANKVVLIGDMGAGYIVATRSMISMVLRERFADADQVGVILVDRIGGAVYNPSAFQAGIV